MREAARNRVPPCESTDSHTAESDGCGSFGFDHPHRERLVRHLQGRDVPVHLADLARVLASRGTLDGDNRSDVETEPRSIYVMLYHDHAPRLADAGVVEFDREDKTVRLADLPELDRAPAD